MEKRASRRCSYEGSRGMRNPFGAFFITLFYRPEPFLKTENDLAVRGANFHSQLSRKKKRFPIEKNYIL